MIYTISDIGSLLKLKSEKDLKNRIRNIELDIDDPSQKMLEKKLNKYYFACGCKEGAIAVYIAMVCFLIAWWLSDFNMIQIGWKIIMITAAAALAGKITGMLLSRRKLRSVMNELEKLFKSTGQ